MLAGTLAALRASIRKTEWQKPIQHIPFGMPEVDAWLKGGLLRGAVHEIHAASGHEATATGFVAGLAHRCAQDGAILWIRQDFAAAEFGELAATGLAELGLDPSRVFVVCVANPSDGLRAASDALSCGALGAVVLEMLGSPKAFDLSASRRLTLASASHGVTLLLLRLSAAPEASAAETRWLVRAAADGEGAPRFAAELLRNRQGRTGQWIMEWKCDERIFQKPQSQANSRFVVPLSANRPPAST
jgi:protein ImuA